MVKIIFPEKTFKKISKVIFVISFLLYGCSAETILIKTSSQTNLIPDSLKRSNIFIYKVIDNREVNKNKIGEINIKNFNKIFELDEPVADYILKYFNSGKDHPGAAKINLFIDQLFPVINIEDDSSFYLYNSFRFFSQIKKDSIIFVKVNKKKLVRYLDENLLYDLNDLLNENIGEFYNNIDQKESGLTDKKVIAEKEKESKNNIILEEAPKTIDEPSVKKWGVGFLYYTGTNITKGYQIDVKFIRQTSSSEIGFGIGAIYFDIVNPPYTGHLFSPGIPIHYKYYLNEDLFSLFIGGSLRINGGTETIKNYYKNSSSFFFGPTVEEFVGLSIGRAFYLEAGAYQLLLAGSRILPNDIGSRFSLSILF